VAIPKGVPILGAETRVPFLSFVPGPLFTSFVFGLSDRLVGFSRGQFNSLYLPEYRVGHWRTSPPKGQVGPNTIQEVKLSFSPTLVFWALAVACNTCTRVTDLLSTCTCNTRSSCGRTRQQITSTGLGAFQCLSLVGWCVAHAILPSCRLWRTLSLNQSIELCKVALKINCLKAFTRVTWVRQRLKHLNQLRRKRNVVSSLVDPRVVVRY